MNRNTIIAIGLALLPLAGCSTSKLLTSNAPTPSIYTLRVAPAAASAETPQTASIIELPKPSVPPGFDTDRIVLLLDDGHRLDYFAAALWPSAFDEVVQDFTRRTIGGRLPGAVVVTPDQALQPGYRLAVKVNEFAPVYDAGPDEGAPKLSASLQFTLIALPAGRVVTSFTLSRHGAANGNDLDAITLGLEAMLQQIETEALTRVTPYLHKS